MEHLPPVSFRNDIERNIIQIPYLVKPDDRHLTFDDFWFPSGWAAIPSRTIDNSLSRFQSCIYFGLLKLIFGGGVIEHLPFILTDNDGSHFVSSVCLPSLFECEDEDLSTWRRIPLDRVERALVTANAYTSTLQAGIEASFSALSPHLREAAGLIALSVSSLVWSLRNLYCNLIPDLMMMSRLRLVPSSWQYRQLVKMGCCPFWSKIHVDTYSVATINYLTAIHKPSDINQHSSCTKSQCIGNDIPEGHYRTAHCCCAEVNCLFLGPSVGALIHFIDNDKIPLIEIKQNQYGTLTLEAIAATPHTRYVAISHVWSGGLGNKSDCALPTCQLERLKTLVDKLTPVHKDDDARHASTIFWMDTLCLPPPPEDSNTSSGEVRRIRRKAMSNMASIYARATTVLILDPHMQNIATHRPEMTELCGRLLTSPWMSRCWTYQEARLAASWAVAYGHDEIFNPVDLLETVVDALIPLVGGQGLVWYDDIQFKKELATLCFGLRPIRDLVHFSQPPVDRFVQVWNELSNRSISKREDIAGNLAIILNLSAKEVLDSGNPHERMRAILRTQKTLPLSMLHEDPCLHPSDYATGAIQQNHTVQGSHWIPDYPRGSLTLAAGVMEWSDWYKTYTFHFDETRCFGVIVDRHLTSRQFLLNATDTPLKRTINIRLDNWTDGQSWSDTRSVWEPDEDDTSSCNMVQSLSLEASDVLLQNIELGPNLHGMQCFVFFRAPVGENSMSSWHLRGAYFTIVNSRRSGLHLKYESGFTYKASDPKLVLTRLSHESMLHAVVTMTDPDLKCILRCDASSWQVLKQQRQSAEDVSQNTPFGISMMTLNLLMTFFWVLGIPWVSLAVSIGTGYSAHDWEIAPIFIALITRTCVYIFFERQRLGKILKKAGEQRWAESLENHDTTALGRKRRALWFRRTLISYQYGRWWSCALILSISVGLVVIGFCVPSFYLIGVFGVLLLAETILRGVGEILWRFTSLGVRLEQRQSQRKLRKTGFKFSDHGSNLQECLKQPLYFSEDFGKHELGMTRSNSPVTPSLLLIKVIEMISGTEVESQLRAQADAILGRRVSRNIAGVYQQVNQMLDHEAARVAAASRVVEQTTRPIPAALH